MPQPTDLPSTQHCLAKALYDNNPDSPDELAFRKGDTLVVLEQNTANIEGWWLCSLRGRQGICPANRLRLIPGVYEDSGQSRVASPHQFTDLHQPQHEFHYLEKQGKRRSWHVHPNQVVTPKRFNDVYLYDIPPTRCSPISLPTQSPGISPRDPSSDCYDVPPRAIPVSNEHFRNSCTRCSPCPPPYHQHHHQQQQQHHLPATTSSSSACASPVNRDTGVVVVGEAYDIPRALNNPNQLTPSSSASSLTADSLSSSNRSSVANMPDYDVPKPYNRGPQLILHPPQQTYDIPTSHTLKELPLELNSALENLERLQTDTTSAITRLQSFVGPKWRTRDRLENTLMEIKLSVTRLGTSLHDLVEFGEGTLGNATRASDKNLAGKLAPMVAAIKKSCNIVQDVLEKLNKHGWSLEMLARPDDEEKIRKPDELEQLIACSRALTEDIRQIASFIQGNGTLLFKRETQQPQHHNQSNNNNHWTEDYDYVSLDSKETIAKSHADILNELPKELKKGYDNCVKHADDVAFDGDYRSPLGADDKQLLTFFAAQVITHHNNLTQAIDAFLQTVEHNQPPKIFLAHGKFVVLSAHKLVIIGDTVHRNVNSREIKERALNCSNGLLDALATSVTKTKQAALQFPSVTAVQEMVDSIVDISHSAKELKVCLVQAANPL